VSIGFIDVRLRYGIYNIISCIISDLAA